MTSSGLPPAATVPPELRVAFITVGMRLPNHYIEVNCRHLGAMQNRSHPSNHDVLHPALVERLQDQFRMELARESI